MLTKTDYVHALRNLRLEAINYRNTGKGVHFLNESIKRAEKVLIEAYGRDCTEALLGEKI